MMSSPRFKKRINFCSQTVTAIVTGIVNVRGNASACRQTVTENANIAAPVAAAIKRAVSPWQPACIQAGTVTGEGGRYVVICHLFVLNDSMWCFVKLIWIVIEVCHYFCFGWFYWIIILNLLIKFTCYIVLSEVKLSKSFMSFQKES